MRCVEDRCFFQGLVISSWRAAEHPITNFWSALHDVFAYCALHLRRLPFRQVDTLVMLCITCPMFSALTVAVASLNCEFCLARRLFPSPLLIGLASRRHITEGDHSVKDKG